MTGSEPRDDSWIGRRVAQHRQTRGWTLSALAEKVGLSATQLSRIESGTRQPSVGTLIEISRAFGISLSQLVEEQYAEPYRLTRFRDRVTQSSANGELTSLSGDFPGLQAVHLVVPPADDPPVAQHAGEEWLYVLSGSISVTIGDKAVSLAEGDAVHFPSHTAHRVHNPGVDPAEILLVSTPTA